VDFRPGVTKPGVTRRGSPMAPLAGLLMSLMVGLGAALLAATRRF
jgi:hypothetical protein